MLIINNVDYIVKNDIYNKLISSAVAVDVKEEKIGIRNDYN